MTNNTPAEVKLPDELTKNLYNLVTPAEAAKVISFVLPVFATLFLTGTFNWLTAINAAIGIAGTVQIFRASQNVWVKTGWAALVAVLQALALVVSSTTGFVDVSRADWWTVIGAAFGALGVAVVPNKVVTAPSEARAVTVVNVASPTTDTSSQDVAHISTTPEN